MYDIYDNKYVKEVVSHIFPIMKLLWMKTTYNKNQFQFPTTMFPSPTYFYQNEK
jgi:hypothetical protein